MSSYRIFIALPTSLEVQNRLALIQSELMKSQADVKWDAPNKFHITLKFLGNVEQDKLSLLYNLMEKAILGRSAFEIVYKLVGAFPTVNNPRVVWTGAEPVKEMMDLQLEVERVCTEIGIPREERLFHPHVTLGRVRSRKNISHLIDAIKSITFQPIGYECKEVLVMKSDLKPEGSIYTALKSFQLKV